jgi:hypothetical protein
MAAWRAANADRHATALRRNAAADKARRVLSQLHKAEYLKLLHHELKKEGLVQ